MVCRTYGFYSYRAYDTVPVPWKDLEHRKLRPDETAYRAAIAALVDGGRGAEAADLYRAALRDGVASTA